MSRPVRVRFAPSPTGFMHVGNARAAIVNYLFARQNNGTFIVRIEDTDAARNKDAAINQIERDLAWLGIQADEAAWIDSQSSKSFLQSERTQVYLDALDVLIKKGKVYKCYCTPARLEQMRKDQKARGLPPRYDEKCRKDSRSERGEPFIWRFSRPEGSVSVETLERGTMTFEMKHFYDAPLTRSDGSFTFLFTNMVDDIDMNISHVIRGQDHLSNTALQAALYRAFDATAPIFMHLPLLSTSTGRKLSKRDEGSSLADLQNAGFLSESVVHYLLSVGGVTLEGTFKNGLIWDVPFEERLTTASTITYDLAALVAIDKEYVAQLSAQEVAGHLLDRYGKKHEVRYIESVIGEAQSLADYHDLLVRVETQPPFDPAVYRDFFQKHAVSGADLGARLGALVVDKDISFSDALSLMKQFAKDESLKLGTVLMFLRFALVGRLKGVSMGALTKAFELGEVVRRLDTTSEAIKKLEEEGDFLLSDS